MKEAEQRFRAIRWEARQQVEPELQAMGGPEVRLSEISDEAVKIATQWRSQYPASRATHVPSWKWETEIRRIKRRPRRVEVALWHGVTLCGLALGRISNNRVVATIHLVESNPVGNPLGGSVVPYLALFLEAVGVIAGSKDVSIEQPVKDLVDYYESLGFTKKVTKGSKILRLMMPLGKSTELAQVPDSCANLKAIDEGKSHEDS